MQAVVSSSSTLKSLISSCRSTLKSLISSSSTRFLQQSPPPSISYWTWQKNKISHRGFLSSWLSTTNYHGTSYHHHRIMYMCSFRGMNMSSSNRGGCRTEEEGKEKGEIIYHAKQIQEPKQGFLLGFTGYRSKTQLYYLQLVANRHGIYTGNLVEFPLEFYGMSSDFRLVGSCNGLICLTGSHHTRYEPMFICNPVTEEKLKLPLPDYCFDYESDNQILYNVISGFGYDEVFNEYKILRIVCDYPNFGMNAFVNTNWKVEIFTLGSDAHMWRRIGNLPCILLSCFEHNKYHVPVFFNGAIHWIGEDYNHCPSNFILAFDVGEEMFRTLQLPPIDTSFLKSFPNYPPNYQLLELGGYLCLNQIFDNSCEIWVMKEYGIESSWTKEYVIPRDSHGWHDDNTFASGPLMLLKNGNIVLHGSKSVVSYDPATNSFVELDIWDTEQLLKVYGLWVTAIRHDSSQNSIKNVVRSSKYRVCRPLDFSAPLECKDQQVLEGESVDRVIAELSAELQKERKKNAELMEKVSLLEAQTEDRDKGSHPKAERVPKKVNLVAQLVRGMRVEDALVQLQITIKRAAKTVYQAFSCFFLRKEFAHLVL